MSKSPAVMVKEQFGDKAKLVAALGPLTKDDLWIDRVSESKGLARVSNAKLLHLFGVLSAVKEKFGTRAKLVDTICEIEKRTKDEGFKKRLLVYPAPRLYDYYRAAAKRAGIATGEAKPKKAKSAAAAPQVAAAAKPAAKKSAAGDKKAAPKAAAKKR